MQPELAQQKNSHWLVVNSLTDYFHAVDFPHPQECTILRLVNGFILLNGFLLCFFHFASYFDCTPCKLPSLSAFERSLNLCSSVLLLSHLFTLFGVVLKKAPCGAGAPLFPPCPFTSSSFPLFTFPFLSLALPILFFCPSLPFLPE